MSKQTKILFASSLKPVDDIRTYHKLGCSLEQENLELYFIGSPGSEVPKRKNHHFIPLKKFHRLSVYRLLLPFKVFVKVLKVKPQIIIINTIDLLILTIPYKIILGGKIVYDIQENYSKNIQHQSVFPIVIKPILMAYAKLLQWLTSHFIDHFILAEQIYSKQLKFIKDRYTILENKSLKKPLNNLSIKDTKKITLLFSGTISRDSGIHNAIKLYESLQKQLPEIHLMVVGLCKDKSLKSFLMEYQINKKTFHVDVSQHYISHDKVLEAIKTVNFGLILYNDHPAYTGKRPTKFFEYLSERLPMICNENLTFATDILKNDAGFTINIKNIDEKELFTNVTQGDFYKSQLVTNPFWDEEKRVFYDLIIQLQHTT